MADTQTIVKQELKNCATMNEIIEVMNKYYDLDHELGVMSKATITMGIFEVVKIASIPER